MMRSLAVTLAVCTVALGCVGRTAPFNELDAAPMTVMRLGPAPAPTAQLPTLPGLPGTAELQALGQQALQGLQQVLPGVIPPGMIPGQPMPAQPAAQAALYKGYAVVGQPVSLVEKELRDEILDLFGREDSFTVQRPSCFTPGLAVTIARPSAPAVELLISLSCNQTATDGFAWPFPNKVGFTTDAHNRLQKLYERLFGPVPSGS